MYTSSADLPWPLPDPRARHFADGFQGMHDLVRPLVIPARLPVNVRRQFETARELVRFSYYHYEFAAMAVYASIIVVEEALRERYPRLRLAAMIDQAATDGLLTAEQAERLHAGRQIRNRYSHGHTMHPAIPPTVAVGLVRVALEFAELCTSPSGRQQDGPTARA